MFQLWPSLAQASALALPIARRRASPLRMLGGDPRRRRGGCLRRFCSRQAKLRRSDLSPSVGFLVALVLGTILWAALWLTWRLARLVFA